MNHLERHDGRIVIKRKFNVPRAALFDAWTNPEMMRRWMLGPKGIGAEVDLRVGGEFHVRAQIPGMDQEVGILGVYQRIDRPHLLVYTFRWDGEPDADATLVNIRFDETTPTTSEMELLHERFSDNVMRDNHAQGWCDCIDTLVKRLEE